ncbi:MAG: DMT family transporter [Nanoarchaeota archaeon]|nr:DMT family transporter [Nanoarchaeota archaeon]
MNNGYFFIIVSAILFGTTGIAIGFIGDEINPFLLTFYRSLIGAITLMIICPLVDSNTFNLKERNFKEDFIIGFLITLSTLLLIIAYQKSSIALVTIITHIYPALTVVLAAIFLNEKLTQNKLVSIIIALIGIIIVNPVSKFGEEGAGIIYSLLVALVSSILIIYMRKTKTRRSLGSTFWFFLFGTILTLPSLYFYETISTLSMSAVLGTLWVGVVGVGLAYLYYDKSFEYADAGVVSIISIVFTPLITIVGSILLLGEELNVRVFVGAFFLLLSAASLQFFSKIQLHSKYRPEYIKSTLYLRFKRLIRRKIEEHKEENS